MSTTLDPLVVKRLLFVRFLFRQGAEQSQKPYPLGAAGMLCFQDAVELFLVLAGQHLSANITDKTPFETCFGEVSTKLMDRDGRQLPSRPAIFQLNKHRVALKHYGLAPSPQALEESRRHVDAFLTAATTLVFGIDLDAIDLADLVTQEKTAELLRKADGAAKVDAYSEAAGHLRAAFDELLRDYGARKKTSYNQGPYSFGPTIHASHRTQVTKRPVASHRTVPDEIYSTINKLGQDLQSVSQAAIVMQQGMRVLAAGLDYRAFARFSMLTPELFMHPDGTWQPRATPTVPFGADEYAFCREFVIEAALRLAELDFDLDLHELARQKAAARANADAQTDSPT